MESNGWDPSRAIASARQAGVFAAMVRNCVLLGRSDEVAIWHNRLAAMQKHAETAAGNIVLYKQCVEVSFELGYAFAIDLDLEPSYPDDEELNGTNEPKQKLEPEPIPQPEYLESA